ncbi:hypothetical protein CDEST_08396 [Colletotrichum destructivum]|uniref:Uncharacterized protein n=1 Tax=Colletotrichum destructivum TaxID=34406 RepID=A0AAX4IIZ2_9PEZI|nr:hypothetical protein CDEST_08396 [Colletotrichum destructivum]
MPSAITLNAIDVTRPEPINQLKKTTILPQPPQLREALLLNENVKHITHPCKCQLSTTLSIVLSNLVHIHNAAYLASAESQHMVVNLILPKLALP